MISNKKEKIVYCANCTKPFMVLSKVEELGINEYIHINGKMA